MFACLKELRDPEYCKEHPKLELSTPEGRFDLEIWAFLNEPADSKIYTTNIEGEENKQALFYIAATPLGVIASLNCNLWQPKNQDLMLPSQVGILSPDRFLIWEASPTLKGYYWGQDILPEKPLTFVVCAGFEDYVEAYIATTATVTPVHLRWKSEQAEQLLGLCTEIIKAKDPEIGIQLSEFLLDTACHKAGD